MRLQSFLAQCGVASRRKAALLIEKGCVTVNGVTVLERGHAIKPDADDIRYEGKRVRFELHETYAFNKPKGVITTMRDTHGRKTVADFFRSVKARLYPVGRLDQETTGLLLMTNDGQLALKITHPRNGCTKVYELTLVRALSSQEMARAQKGMWIESGKTAPCRIKFIGKDKMGFAYRMWLNEGKKRQIRLMMSALHAGLRSLHRSAVGPIRIGRLRPGAHRLLTKDEVNKLQKG